MGQGSRSGQGLVRRAASKQPVVEASDDFEEEYDSQDDAHYVDPNDDAEIPEEDDRVDVEEEEEEESGPEQAIRVGVPSGICLLPSGPSQSFGLRNTAILMRLPVVWEWTPGSRTSFSNEFIMSFS